jgi:hypothetical protein
MRRWNGSYEALSLRTLNACEYGCVLVDVGRCMLWAKQSVSAQPGRFIAE